MNDEGRLHSAPATVPIRDSDDSNGGAVSGYAQGG